MEKNFFLYVKKREKIEFCYPYVFFKRITLTFRLKLHRTRKLFTSLLFGTTVVLSYLDIQHFHWEKMRDCVCVCVCNNTDNVIMLRARGSRNCQICEQYTFPAFLFPLFPPKGDDRVNDFPTRTQQYSLALPFFPHFDTCQFVLHER